MQSFEGSLGTTYHFRPSLYVVIVEDEQGNEVKLLEAQEFLDFVRQLQLQESEADSSKAEEGTSASALGTYETSDKTTIRYNLDLTDVTITDKQGTVVKCNDFHEFAALMRERSLETTLQNNEIDTVL